MRTNLTVAAIIATVTLLVIGFHLVSDTEEFSRYNHGWNGTSDFFSELNPHQSTDIMQISDLAGAENATLLLIAPSGMYSATDIEEIRAFTETGNTLVIADETGTANPILQGIGSEITIEPGMISSIDRTYNDSYVIVTSPTSDHPLVANLSSLVLNQGVWLTGGEPLVQTSMMSWIDSDSDRRISGDESFGKRVVMSREKIGQGEIIVISDSAIFINSMLKVGDEWGNREFVSRLITYRPVLYLEQVQSRTAVPDGPGKILYLLRSSTDLKLVLAMFLLLTIVVLVYRRRLWEMNDDLDTRIPGPLPGQLDSPGPEMPTNHLDFSDPDTGVITEMADREESGGNRSKDDQ